MHFTGIKFCISYSVNDIHDGLFGIFNFYKYYILLFCANPQKYQTLVPANNSHLKVVFNQFAIEYL